MRKTKEWIGKTDDSYPPNSVRLRIFLAHGGICHISGRPIRPGERWDLEHVLAICNGGENRESNLAPALAAPHRIKTKTDRKLKAKTDRKRMTFLGIKKPKRKIPYRLFDGTIIDPNKERQP